MLDTDLDDSFEDRDGMFRYELLECNQERSLKGDRALDYRPTERRLVAVLVQRHTVDSELTQRHRPS